MIPLAAPLLLLLPLLCPTSAATDRCLDCQHEGLVTISLPQNPVTMHKHFSVLKDASNSTRPCLTLPPTYNRTTTPCNLDQGACVTHLVKAGLRKGNETYQVEFMRRSCQPVSSEEKKCYEIDGNNRTTLSPWMMEHVDAMKVEGFTAQIEGQRCFCSGSECNAGGVVLGSLFALVVGMAAAWVARD